MDIYRANENKDVVWNPELWRKTKTDITGFASRTTDLYVGAQKSLTL